MVGPGCHVLEVHVHGEILQGLHLHQFAEVVAELDVLQEEVGPVAIGAVAEEDALGSCRRMVAARIGRWVEHVVPSLLGGDTEGVAYAIVNPKAVAAGVLHTDAPVARRAGAAIAAVFCTDDRSILECTLAIDAEGEVLVAHVEVQAIEMLGLDRADAMAVVHGDLSVAIEILVHLRADVCRTLHAGHLVHVGVKLLLRLDDAERMTGKDCIDGLSHLQG